VAFFWGAGVAGVWGQMSQRGNVRSTHSAVQRRWRRVIDDVYTVSRWTRSTPPAQYSPVDHVTSCVLPPIQPGM